jgi:hypothetical protein
LISAVQAASTLSDGGPLQSSRSPARVGPDKANAAINNADSRERLKKAAIPFFADRWRVGHEIIASAPTFDRLLLRYPYNQ